MTDPNTEALTGLAFCANALIEIRDEDGNDKNLVAIASQTLTLIQAAMILACGRPEHREPNRG